MALHLVRHATARDRSRWDGDDLDRPLTEQGHEQAEALRGFFVDRPVRGIYSSQATRCLQTVEPLAASLGLVVERRRELTEGAKVVNLLELLRSEASVEGDLVLCSHGDLIPEVLNYLLRDGLPIVGGRGCEKGSVWTLETVGHDFVRGCYTARFETGDQELPNL